jgi:hypothetical protein
MFSKKARIVFWIGSGGAFPPFPLAFLAPFPAAPSAASVVDVLLRRGAMVSGKIVADWLVAGAFFKIKGARTGDFTPTGRALPHFCSVCNVP